MLHLKNINKEYVTGDLRQRALDNVSLSLRDNEFVAILGQSGSGKTTLLNIIGGLDRYDSGDIIINDISTKKYKDRDWDSYRNHTIGFIFQSYNLIPHQSILSNVELALTISGVSKSQRRKKAKEALEKVGLGDQIHKRPNQMSGGQMQRVAIARALVNDPDILLADEPTGALDSETSIQVLDLLKEIASDRLVVMVTHNPELSEKYATRTVKLKDGKIISDSNPLQADEEVVAKAEHKNMGKSSMSFMTSLSLSLNNLRTKKGRTFLTAFAGSIGIIGIALILSISTGVNDYIDDIQRDTMTSYPITIDATSIDLSSFISMGQSAHNNDSDNELDKVYSDDTMIEMASSMTSSIAENNLSAFKDYLESEDNEITPYVGENGVIYSYTTKFGLYSYDPDGTLVNTDGSGLNGGSGDSGYMSDMSSALVSTTGNYEELTPGSDGTGISDIITDNYDLIYGEWPENYDEIIIVVDANNEISTETLYELGILPAEEYNEMYDQIMAGEEVTLDSVSWTYEELCEKEFYLIPACDSYVLDDSGYYTLVTDPEELISSAITLNIVGIIRQSEDASTLTLSATICYTSALTDYLIDYTNNSDIVVAQMADTETNVLNGLSFSPSDDATKAADTITYLTNLGVTEKASVALTLFQASSTDEESSAYFATMEEPELAAMLDSYLLSPDDTVLVAIYDAYISTGTYDENLTNFGVVNLDAPDSISIYVDSFEDKDYISAGIEIYNETASEENQITYTDYVAMMISSITTIIDVISYVLIAFVAVSLIVSSIMIGIITYISVLERTKEIGILRAIGASKKNISQVFNAETFIIGLISGLLGIGITVLLTIPINAIIHKLTGIMTVNATLPVVSAVILVLLSMGLTTLGGLIPSKKAAKKDPVTALRTE